MPDILINEWKGDAPSENAVLEIVVEDVSEGMLYEVEFPNEAPVRYRATNEDTTGTVGQKLFEQMRSWGSWQMTYHSAQARILMTGRESGAPIWRGLTVRTPPASQVIEVQQGAPAVTQQFELVFPATTSGGMWDLSLDFGSGAEALEDLDWDISSAELKAEIEGLDTPEEGDVEVLLLGTFPRRYRITLGGSLASGDNATVTADGSRLTGNATATVERAQAGGQFVSAGDPQVEDSFQSEGEVELVDHETDDSYGYRVYPISISGTGEQQAPFFFQSSIGSQLEESPGRLVNNGVLTVMKVSGEPESFAALVDRNFDSGDPVILSCDFDVKAPSNPINAAGKHVPFLILRADAASPGSDYIIVAADLFSGTLSLFQIRGSITSLAASRKQVESGGVSSVPAHVRLSASCVEDNGVITVTAVLHDLGNGTDLATLIHSWEAPASNVTCQHGWGFHNVDIAMFDDAASVEQFSVSGTVLTNEIHSLAIAGAVGGTFTLTRPDAGASDEVIVDDTFTAEDDTNVSSHESESGHSWYASGQAKIKDNHLVPSQSGHAFVIHDHAQVDARYIADFRVQNPDNRGNAAFVFRYGDSANFITAGIVYDGSSQVLRLSRTVSGSTTTIDTDTSTTDILIEGEPYRLECDVEGDLFTCRMYSGEAQIGEVSGETGALSSNAACGLLIGAAGAENVGIDRYTMLIPASEAGPRETDPIAHTAFSATMEAALETLYDDVTVTGNGTVVNPFLIEYQGNDGGKPLALLEADASLLQGGIVNSTLLRAAEPGINAQQRIIIDPSAIGGTVTVGPPGEPSAPVPFEADSGAWESALQAIPLIGVGNVIVDGEPGSLLVEFINEKQWQPIPLMEIDDTLLVLGGSSILSVNVLTPGTGPADYSNAGNWTLGRVPNSGERIVFGSGRQACTWGLVQRGTWSVPDVGNRTPTLFTSDFDLVEGQIVRLRTTGDFPSAEDWEETPIEIDSETDYYIIAIDYIARTLQLATGPGEEPIYWTDQGEGVHAIEVQAESLQFYGRYSGRIGLPRRNGQGAFEWMPRYLAIGLLSPDGTADNVVIGVGEGEHSPMIMLDVDESVTRLLMLNSGSGTGELPAVNVLARNPATELHLVSGELGMALEPSERARIGRVNSYNARAALGNVRVANIGNFNNGVHFVRGSADESLVETAN